MKKKNSLILVLIVLVLIGVGAGGFFIIKDRTSEKVYKEKMAEGRKHLSKMQYEEAVAAFEFALEEKPEEDTPYISIYRARIAQGEIRLAQRVLRQGYRATGNERFAGLLESCEAKLTETQNESEDKAEVDSQEVTINIAMLQKLEKYTYASYNKEFGKYISHEMSGDSLEMVHSGIEAVFTYQNKGSQKEAVNTAKKLPNENAKPVSIRLANINMLFKNFGEGISFERLSEIVGSKVECEYNEEVESYVDTFTYRECKIEIACAENGDIVKSSAWNRITPPEGTQEGEKATVEGIILNAVTGQGLESVHLLFKPEEKELEQVETNTDSIGNFSAEMEPGEYEVEVSKDGFITDSFELEVEKDTPVSGIQFPLSPELAMGEIRIVLTWNAYPRDLDSHLEGRTASGAPIHVFYGKRSETVNGQTAVDLDVDEISGFGPETTTIYMDGTYSFRIHDFTGSGEMSGSGAQVKVYTADGAAPEVFDIPQGTGNDWNVFNIENGKIVPVNTITE